MATSKKAPRATPARRSAKTPQKPSTKNTKTAKPAAKSARPKRTTAAVAPPAKARAEYDALLREIADADRDELRGWDRKWEAVATVLAKKYFLLDDDAPSAAEWMKKHTREEYRTGFRYARVARLASPDEEQRFTVTKIDLAYSLDDARRRAAAKAKGEEPPDEPRKLDLHKLRYTVERDGAKVTVGLEDISVAELRALQSSESRAKGSPDARVSKSAKAVIKAIAADRSLRSITVRERDNKLTLDEVRADQLVALGRALVSLGRGEGE